MTKKTSTAAADPADLPSWPVLSPLHHDGEPYAIGDTVAMAEAVAAPLVAAGVLGPAVPATPAAPAN